MCMKLLESARIGELPKGKVGPLAQLVEQRTFNPWVDGSSPSGPTKELLTSHRKSSQVTAASFARRSVTLSREILATEFHLAVGNSDSPELLMLQIPNKKLEILL
jgi:hypothetical protein